ncbi:outer membrane beta-barrel protein [Aliiglaciecola sp. LCG003]|uniref:outer membrane beta-barrel protein n=1 Tax=Aliiglaciecola sp. LCG003 TaxID=3053655 RepID=UPI0025723D2F|nr:outer membrane beta-barrel protein [Aliiglaciecola sp. LCG003]WJG10477.1 outer membrane beta-barrel protein [Aliiglaciecola sp. LCG003]
MKILQVLLVLGGLSASTSSLAADNLYGVISGGFGKSDFQTNDSESGAYKFALGYQFHRQWYAEFGYQQLSGQDLLIELPSTQDSLEQAEFGLTADAIVASVLGKASGNMGELFYRLGVMKVDIEGQNLTESSQCEFGEVRPFTLSSGEDYTLCEYDEAVLAGVIGVGFDFYLGVHFMLRAEVEHVKGEHDFSNNAAYLGLRYNF